MSRNAPHVLILTSITGLSHYALLTSDMAKLLSGYGLSTGWYAFIDRSCQSFMWLGSLAIVVHLIPKAARLIANGAEAVIKFWDMCARGIDFVCVKAPLWVRRWLRSFLSILVAKLEENLEENVANSEVAVIEEPSTAE